MVSFTCLNLRSFACHPFGVHILQQPDHWQVRFDGQLRTRVCPHVGVHILQQSDLLRVRVNGCRGSALCGMPSLFLSILGAVMIMVGASLVSTHSPSHSLSLSLSHSLSLTPTLSLSLALALSHSLSHAHTLSTHNTRAANSTSTCRTRDCTRWCSRLSKPLVHADAQRVFCSLPLCLVVRPAVSPVTCNPSLVTPRLLSQVREGGVWWGVSREAF